MKFWISLLFVFGLLALSGFAVIGSNGDDNTAYASSHDTGTPPPPTVVLSTDVSDPTPADPIPFSVRFSEAVTGFDATDITHSSGTVQNFYADHYTRYLRSAGASATPNDVAIDGADGIYALLVYGDGTGRANIIFYNEERGGRFDHALYDTLDSGTANGQVKSPRSMIIHNPTNFFYIVDTGNDRIQVLNDAALGFISKFGTTGTGNGQFDKPSDIAINSTGFVYVTDSMNNRVQIFDDTLINRNYVGKFGSQGSGDGEFNDPRGIAIDPDGNIYVADFGNDRVQIFDPDGTYQRQIGGAINSTANGEFDGPIDIALDTSKNIYVNEQQNDRISIFSNDGTYQRQIGIGLDSNLPGALDGLRGIAIDSEDDIYVAEAENHRFQQLSSTTNDYTFEIDGSTDRETLTVSIAADAADNAAKVGNLPSNVISRDVDRYIPTPVTLSTTVSDSTNADTIPFTVRFDEPVIGFDATDITHSSGTVQNFDTTHHLLYLLRVDSQTSPVDVVVDSKGFVHTLSQGTASILDIYDPINNRRIHPSNFKVITNADASGGLKSPQSMAIDSDGNYYIVDVGNKRIKIFDADGGYQSEFGAEALFGKAWGIAINSTGFFYVTDSQRDRIHIFNSSYAYQGHIGGAGQGTGDGEFNDPRGIALDSNDNIYVADFRNDRVQIFDNGGTYQRQIGGAAASTADGEFNKPVDIALDSNDNIYVNEIRNDRIQIFDNDGTYRNQIGSTINSDSPGEFDGLRGIAIDADGDIFVAELANARYQKLVPVTSQYTFEIVGLTDQETLSVSLAVNVTNNAATTFGNAPSNEISITIDRVAPTVSSASFTSATSIALTASKSISGTNVAPGDFAIGGVTPATAVSTVDVSGSTITLTLSVPITGSDTPTVSYTTGSNPISDDAGNALAAFDIQPMTDGIDTIPLAVDLSTVASSPTNLDSIPFTVQFSEIVTGFDVSDITKSSGTVENFDSSHHLLTFDEDADTTNFPTAIAINSTGYIHVIESVISTIHIFDSNDQRVGQFGGTFGTGNGEFSSPQDITINSTGHIYIADTDNNRIQIFGSDGTYLNQFGTRGSDNGEFISPTGITINSTGYIYVTDTENDRVQIFDSNHAYQAQFGSVTDGTGDGEFNAPNGIALDSNDNIYVTDTGNDRVQIFDKGGTYQRQIGGVIDSTANGEFDQPAGIAIDSDNNIYVAEVQNDRVQIFDSDGTYQRQFGGVSNGTGDGEFNEPRDVTIASDGNIYVVDSLNHRVQKFTPTPRYTFDITGSTDGETLTVSIAADVANNAASLGNTPSDVVSLAIDRAIPTVSAAIAATPTSVELTVSESVSGDSITLDDFTIGDVTDTTTVTAVDVSGSTITLTLSVALIGSDTPTVSYSAAASTISDDAGNALAAFGPQSISNNLDTTAPTVSIVTTGPNPTNSATISFTATFSENVSGFDTSDITTSSGTPQNITPASTSPPAALQYTFEVANPNDQTTLTVSIPAGAAQDASANDNAASDTVSVDIDRTAPTVSAATATTPTSVALTVSESVSGDSITTTDFAIGDVTTATTVTTVDVSGSTITLTLSVPIADSDSPTVAYTRSTAAITDDAGNVLEAFGARSITNGLDSTPPTIVSVTVTTTTFITLTVSESVTGLSITAGDFTIGGVATPTTVTTVDVSGTTITLTLSTPITGSDTPTVSYTSSSSTIDDAAGNALATFSGQSITNDLDLTGPTVTIATSVTSPTNADPIPFTAEFSETVTGFNATDITISSGTVENFDTSHSVLAHYRVASFSNPSISDVAVNSTGHVFVVDDRSGIIDIINSTAHRLGQFGDRTSGTDDGRFNSPRGIAINSNDEIYIVDSNNNRIQKFSNTGGFLDKFGSAGTGDSQFDSPNGIAINSTGYIFVVDTANDRVQIFDSAHVYQGQIGGVADGTGDGEFNAPRHITIDSNDNIYVAGFANDRVQIFDRGGTYQRVIGGTLNSTAEGQFNGPDGIALDSNDNIYVSDNINDRVQIFNNDGTYKRLLGNTNSFDGPRGIAIDSDSNIYIADRGNDRVSIFSISPTHTFDITGSTDQATLTVSIPAGAAQDDDAIDNLASNILSLYVDRVEPVISSAIVTNTTAITLTTSEPVFSTNPRTTDFTIGNVNSSPIVSTVVVSGDTITLKLYSQIKDSDVAPTVSYIPTFKIADAADNQLAAFDAQPITNNLDTTAPTVVSATAVSTTSVVLTISEPVSGSNIAPSDFQILGILPPPTAVTAVVISGNTITLTLSIPLIDSATPSLTYNAASGPISDAAGHALGTISSQSITNNLDNTIPTVTVSTTVRSPTSLDTIPFTVRVNEEISGFDVSDIIVSSGTVRDLTPVSISSLSSTVLLYTFNVTNPADQTTLTVSIPAGAVQDSSGNSNTVPSMITIDTDRTAPVLSSAITASTTTIVLTISEPVSETGITPTDFTIGDVATSTTVSAVDVSGSTITLTLSVPITGSDSPTVSYTAAASTISDVAGNTLAAFGPQPITNSLDTTAPTVTFASAATPTSITLTISEPVFGNNITPTDFTISGVATSTTVSSVDVFGTTITLTLSDPITGSDTPTVSYTASSNPISDAAGNALGTISSQSVSNNLEAAPPIVTSAVAVTTTSVVLTISEPVSGSNIAPSDFRIFGIPSPPTVVTAVVISGNTITLTLSIPLIDSTTPSVTYTAASGPISNAEGHALGTISSQSVTNDLDTTIPTVTVSTTVRSPTDLDIIPFTVRLNEEISGFDVSDITVSSGTVQDLTPVSISSSSSTVLLYTFNVVNPTDQTTLTVSIPAGAVQDGSGNSNTVPSTITIDIDRMIPVLSSAITASTTTIALTISQSVSGTGITPTDFTIGGVATPTTVSTVDISGNTITLTLSVPIIDSDSPTVSYTAASNPISNAAGNTLAAFGPQSVSNNLDTTAPTVISASAEFPTFVTLTVSEPISGNNITPTDFTISGVATSATVSAVDVFGTTITLTLSDPITGSDTPTVSYTAAASTISDAAGNALGTFSSQSVSINLEAIPPIVTSAVAATSTSVVLTISEPVSGSNIAPSDFRIFGIPSPPTVVTAVEISGNTITLTLSIPLIDSTTPSVTYTAASGPISNAAGNALGTISSQSVTNNLDNTIPTVTVSTTIRSPTDLDIIPFTVRLNEEISGFDVSDITVSSGTVQDLTPVSPSSSSTVLLYTFNVVNPADQTTLTVSIPAGAVQDGSGNSNTVSSTITIDIDRMIPVLSSAAATSTTTIALTISESVSGTGITPTDFTIDDVATPTTVSAVAVSGNTITLTLSVPIIDSDSPTVSYTAASNPISNAAGDALAAFGPQSISNNLDTTAPTVISAVAVTTTSVVLTISEPVSGSNIAATDFRIFGIPSPPTTVTTVEISGNIIILTLSRPLAESETPSLSYTASSNPISDAAGNALGTISSQSVSINLDTTPPTVTLASAVTPTSVTLTISESVSGTGVTPGDFTIDGVATPTTVSAVDVSGDTITLTLSVPITGSDSPTVSYTSSSSTIDDVAGNALESFTDQSIINSSDTAAPTVTITTSTANPANTEPVPFTINFSEQVTGFTAGDITISSGTVQSLSPTPSQSVTSYTFTVAGPTNGTALVVSMPAGAVQDLAGNANAVSNTVSLDIDIDPVIPPTRPTAPTRSGGGGGGGGGGESIPPSLTRSFDNGYKSITINNVGISPERSGANYLQSPPISVSTGVQTPIQIILYENISWNLVSHVELCMNDVVATNQACDGDTKIIWDKSRGDNNLEIVDPHNLINDGRTSVDRSQVSNNVVTFDFDIEFVGAMDVSDLTIHAWDTNRNALVYTVENAIKVVSAGTTTTNDDDDDATTTTNDDDDTTTTTSGTTTTNDDDSDNDTDSTDNDNSSTSSNTATLDREILKQWTGFASKSISDTEFLTHVGIYNKDRSSNSGTSGDDDDDISLPSWTKNMVGKWALQDKISTDELKAVLSYVHDIKSR